MAYLEELDDQTMRIPTKKEVEVCRQPPKVKGKHFRNLEYLADASLTCLTPDSSKMFPNETYNPELDTSYFDQCFTAVNKLGEGSFGSVLQVLSKADCKKYAIKVSKEPFKSDRDREVKLAEVRNLRLFSSHENIVTLYEAWEEDRHLYLQMELCVFSLDKVEEPMSDKQCWSVLADIASALAAIHAEGIGHFDVKPENIQLGEDKKYKLGDFGLAYNFVKGQPNVPTEGDSKYLAPELLSAVVSDKFTAKADIFSLAITIVELAGNLYLPSHGDVWQALRNGHLPKSILKSISMNLFLVLKSMMQPKPEARPTAAEILQNNHVLVALAQDVEDRVTPSIHDLSSSLASTSTASVATSTPFNERVPGSANVNYPSPSPIQGDRMDTSENFVARAVYPPSCLVSGLHAPGDILKDVKNIICSPTASKLGFSPLRLSEEMKAEVRAKNHEVRREVRQLKRRLFYKCQPEKGN